MKILIALVSVILIGALAIPFFGRVTDCGQTREQSDIRQLCIVVAIYVQEKNRFPNTIIEALNETQTNDPYLIEFTKSVNFLYSKPQLTPSETSANTVIIEYSKEGTQFFGYVDGHVEAHQPKG